jgi:hypothetical protein
LGHTKANQTAAPLLVGECLDHFSDRADPTKAPREPRPTPSKSPIPERDRQLPCPQFVEQPGRELTGFQTDPRRLGRLLRDDRVNAFGRRAALASPDDGPGIVDDDIEVCSRDTSSPTYCWFMVVLRFVATEALMLQAPASAITGCPDPAYDDRGAAADPVKSAACGGTGRFFALYPLAKKNTGPAF